MTYQEAVDEQGLNMDGWREGYPPAFKDVFFHLYPSFLSFADVLLHDRQTAQQVTTEAFFILWKKREDLDELKNIRTFLYNTIRNHALNYLKQLQQDPSSREYIPVFYPDPSLGEEMIREIRAFAAG